MQQVPLLQTKLLVPPIRPKLVARPRLVDRLNAGLDHRLVLVSAPAGFGKTTLQGWVLLPTGQVDAAETWASLAEEAAYEATVCAAILNARHTGNKRLYLTQLGGGAFGNRTTWISDSITRALKLYQDWNLEVAIVSYRRSRPSVQQLVDQFR